MVALQDHQIEPFEIEDMELDVLPGGAGEPVIHVGAVVGVIILVYASPAY